VSERSRQFEHLQESTLARLRAHIPAGCPLTVERAAVGFKVTGPRCEQTGRAQVVTAFIDGFVAAWETEWRHVSADIGPVPTTVRMSGDG